MVAAKDDDLGFAHARTLLYIVAALAVVLSDCWFGS